MEDPHPLAVVSICGTSGVQELELTRLGFPSRSSIIIQPFASVAEGLSAIWGSLLDALNALVTVLTLSAARSHVVRGVRRIPLVVLCLSSPADPSPLYRSRSFGKFEVAALPYSSPLPSLIRLRPSGHRQALRSSHPSPSPVPVSLLLLTDTTYTLSPYSLYTFLPASGLPTRCNARFFRLRSHRGRSPPPRTRLGGLAQAFHTPLTYRAPLRMILCPAQRWKRGLSFAIHEGRSVKLHRAPRRRAFQSLTLSTSHSVSLFQASHSIASPFLTLPCSGFPPTPPKMRARRSALFSSAGSHSPLQDGGSRESNTQRSRSVYTPANPLAAHLQSTLPL